MSVAVVGGGYAGMAAALTLSERGIPVTVYEAGRELGDRPSSIHGPEHALIDQRLEDLLDEEGVPFGLPDDHVAHAAG